MDPIEPTPDGGNDFWHCAMDDLRELADPVAWAVTIAGAACVWLTCWALNALGVPL